MIKRNKVKEKEQIQINSKTKKMKKWKNQFNFDFLIRWTPCWEWMPSIALDAKLGRMPSWDGRQSGDRTKFWAPMHEIALTPQTFFTYNIEHWYQYPYMQNADNQN
uniref:Uncharacterized protein n=1 Tax=Romanomermis culicivorax TaxID=13658 RepID=A0A915JL44_ROMCU